MKYEKCLSCEQLGTKCDGPNLLAMDTIDLGLWCNELRKENPGMTYDKIAADTFLSKSAVRDFCIGKHEDCSMHTARTIAKYVTNGKWDDNPCGNITNSEKITYEDRIKQLESEIKWRDDKIQHLTANFQSMQTLVKNTNDRNTKDKDFLRGQIKSKNKTIIALSICLGIGLTLIITALVIDRLNGDMGFFWLESLFNRSTENDLRMISKLIGWSA